MAEQHRHGSAPSAQYIWSWHGRWQRARLSPMCVALENELKAKNVNDRLCSEATAILRDETGKV